MIKWKKLLSVLLSVLLAVSMLPTGAEAAKKAKATAMRLEQTEGTVTLRDERDKVLSLSEGMKLYSGYTLETGDASYAYLSLDDAKAVKLDAYTKVSVKVSGKKLELKLLSGALCFDVKEKLSGGESFQISTSTMTTGIRGTIGIIKYPNIVNQTPLVSIQLLEGQVIVQENGGTGRRFALSAGQMLSLLRGSGSQPDVSIENLTPEQIPAFALLMLQDNPRLGHDILTYCKNTDMTLRLRDEEAKVRARKISVQSIGSIDRKVNVLFSSGLSGVVVIEKQYNDVLTWAGPEVTAAETDVPTAETVRSRVKKNANYILQLRLDTADGIFHLPQAMLQAVCDRGIKLRLSTTAYDLLLTTENLQSLTESLTETDSLRISLRGRTAEAGILAAMLAEAELEPSGQAAAFTGPVRLGFFGVQTAGSLYVWREDSDGVYVTEVLTASYTQSGQLATCYTDGLSGFCLTDRSHPSAPAGTESLYASLTYGEPLSAAVLEGQLLDFGEVTWENPAALPSAADGVHRAVFTPSAWAERVYAMTRQEWDVNVTVLRAKPGTPQGLTAVYGQTLADVALPADYAFPNPGQSVGAAGPQSFTVNYTPTGANADNYVPQSDIPVIVTVEKAVPDYALPVMSGVYGQLLKDVVITPLAEGSFAIEEPSDTPLVAGEQDIHLTYTPPDVDNYQVLTGIPAKVTVAKAPLTLELTKQNCADDEITSVYMLTGNQSGGLETAVYKAAGDPDTAYDAAVPTAPGNYTLRVSVAETANYLPASATADFTIIAASKATVTTLELMDNLNKLDGSMSLYGSLIWIPGEDGDPVPETLYINLNAGGTALGPIAFTPLEISVSAADEYRYGANVELPASTVASVIAGAEQPLSVTGCSTTSEFLTQVTILTPEAFTFDAALLCYLPTGDAAIQTFNKMEDLIADESLFDVETNTIMVPAGHLALLHAASSTGTALGVNIDIAENAALTIGEEVKLTLASGETLSNQGFMYVTGGLDIQPGAAVEVGQTVLPAPTMPPQAVMVVGEDNASAAQSAVTVAGSLTVHNAGILQVISGSMDVTGQGVMTLVGGEYSYLASGAAINLHSGELDLSGGSLRMVGDDAGVGALNLYDGKLKVGNGRSFNRVFPIPEMPDDMLAGVTVWSGGQRIGCFDFWLRVDDGGYAVFPSSSGVAMFDNDFVQVTYYTSMTDFLTAYLSYVEAYHESEDAPAAPQLRAYCGTGGLALSGDFELLCSLSVCSGRFTYTGGTMTMGGSAYLEVMRDAAFINEGTVDNAGGFIRVVEGGSWDGNAVVVTDTEHFQDDNTPL